MRLLALESSSRLCSVALQVDGEVRLRCAADDARNSEVLLPMVKALLAEAGLSLQSLDALAFGSGPGAFTGLRVACGAAQGLAFGADLPVVPVGTLEILAESTRGEVAVGSLLPVLAGLDARMGEVYWGQLRATGDDWVLQRGPLLCRPDAVPLPPASAGGWQAVGEAFVVHANVLAQRLGPIYTLDADHPLLPRADALARLAASRFLRGLAVAPELAQPLYVRDKVAQTQAERASARATQA